MNEQEHVEEPEVDMDALIGRIIDREATSQEFAEFEQQAAVDPILWKTLALGQIDMADLSERVIERVGAAEQVELGPDRHRRSAVGVLVTFSGWAAVLVVGLWWANTGGVGEPQGGVPPVQPAEILHPAAPPLSADDHFDEYLRAGFVLGEWDPILLETEQLEDGRYRFRIVRRVEEYVVVDRLPSEVLDENGDLVDSPGDLRREE